MFPHQSTKAIPLCKTSKNTRLLLNMNILIFVMCGIISELGATEIQLVISLENHPSETSIISCFQSLETNDIEEGVPKYLSLLENYRHLVQDPEAIAEAADAAYKLLLTDTADSLLRVLSLDYPESGVLFSSTRKLFNRIVITGNSRDNPSERAALAEAFLHSYSDIHPYWTSAAYRIISLDSLRNTEDLEQWTDSCPTSPEGWLKRAEAAAEDSLWIEELEYAEEGLAVSNSWTVPGMSLVEFDLYFSAFRNHLTMRKAEALWKLDNKEDALQLISPLLRFDLYPPADFHSPAPFYLLAGRIGNRTDYLIDACVAGDLNNLYSGEAEALLKQTLGREYMSLARDSYTGPIFEERTEQYLGNQPIPGVRHEWSDLNNDEIPDLIIGDRVYTNNGERLNLQTTLSYPCNGAAAVDLNGDGFADIVTGGENPAIWLTDSIPMEYSPVFLEIPQGPVEGIAFPDWNRDDLPDICMAIYETPCKTGKGNDDRLYINNGDGTFSESNELSTLPEGPWCGRDVDLVDIDGDGYDEIFISNYRNQPNSLWLNSYSLPEDIASVTNTAGEETGNSWGNTIGSAWQDYDNDGDQDLFSANLAHPRDITTSDRSMLLENNNGVFADITESAGIRYEETHSYPAWEDFDGDGNMDLYITCIWENRRSFLYRNNGDGTFSDNTWMSGTRVFNSWGISTTDVNLDGKPDISVNADGYLRIFINTTP